MRSRFSGANDLDDMPAAIELQRQLELLSKRLQHASSLSEFSHWAGASGTVIMSDVFTRPRFYSGVPDYLYLYLQVSRRPSLPGVARSPGIPRLLFSFPEPCPTPSQTAGSRSSCIMTSARIGCMQATAR